MKQRRMISLFRCCEHIILRSLLLLIVMLICSCDDENQTKPEKPKYDITPNNTLWDFSMKFMDGNSIKASLSARRARLYAEKNESLVDTNVVAEFYSVYGNRVARLTADSARIDNRTNNMWAYKNVRVIGDSSKTTLETSVLMWDNTRRKLTSDKYVKISRPGELIEGGIGFESDEDLQNYRIYQVKGVKSR